MIIGYQLEHGGLTRTETRETAVWLDLHCPSEEERALVSGIIGFAAPSRADQEEIELSSRLYVENGAAVMTALLPAKTQTDAAEVAPVTFILTNERLVTLRHHEPRPFETYPPRAGRAALPCDSATTVLIGLLEDVIDRLADLTEFAGREIEALARIAFRREPLPGGDLRDTLGEIGRRDSLVTRLRDSLVTMERLVGFLSSALEQRKPGKEVRAMVKSQLRDVRTISEQAGFLMQKTSFLLDATLGLINIEQNAIIKIFSVVAAAFLPPTLIASIYGMNFHVMPELGWSLGYPAALVLMVISAVLPLWYFRRRGWL